MTNLEQRIHDLPPERFARSAHAAAALAIRAAELAGKEPPPSALWIKKQSEAELIAQQKQRLDEEALAAVRTQAEPVGDVWTPEGVKYSYLLGTEDRHLPEDEAPRGPKEMVFEALSKVRGAAGSADSFSFGKGVYIPGVPIVISTYDKDDLTYGIPRGRKGTLFGGSSAKGKKNVLDIFKPNAGAEVSVERGSGEKRRRR